MSEMHPLVRELNEKREEKKMSLREAASLVKVSYNTLHSWVNGEKKARDKSLDKVRVAIEKIDGGEWQVPKEEKPAIRYKKLPKSLSIKQRTMYNRIHALEIEYGDLTNVPEGNEDLTKIRKWAE